MAKTLEFAYGTPHEVKVGDDETTFTLVCKNEDLLVDLTTAKSITAKIGNSSGYLREQLINIDNLVNLTTGQFKFNFDKDTLANFPTGNYFLEVWVTDNQGTSIYPSGSPLNFTVTANIENSSGASITTIAFDDFVKAINKAASTIAKGDKGDKGDTGTVDNAGLTTAPAFVALQTQVNNSAVGTNMIVASTITKGYYLDSNGKAQIGQLNFISDYITVSSSTNYTIRIQSGASGNTRICEYDANKNFITRQMKSGTIVTFKTGSSTAYVRISPDCLDTNYYESPIKMELGSVATDWCPNPTEILTKSDYTKIQAAIVALGGSLS